MQVMDDLPLVAQLLIWPLSVQRFVGLVPSLSVNVTCTRCTGLGIPILAQLMDLLFGSQSDDVLSLFAYHMSELSPSVLKSDAVN